MSDEYDPREAIFLEGVFRPFVNQRGKGVMITPFLGREDLRSVLSSNEFTKLVSYGLFMCQNDKCTENLQGAEGEFELILNEYSIHYKTKRYCVRCQHPMMFVVGISFIEYISEKIARFNGDEMCKMLGEASRVE